MRRSVAPAKSEATKTGFAHRGDFLAWSRVASVMAAGKNVYASTKYTYGPISAEMLQLSNPERARGPERPPHCGQPPAKLVASSGLNTRLYTWKSMSELRAAGLPAGTSAPMYIGTCGRLNSLSYGFWPTNVPST